MRIQPALTTAPPRISLMALSELRDVLTAFELGDRHRSRRGA